VPCCRRLSSSKSLWRIAFEVDEDEHTATPLSAIHTLALYLVFWQDRGENKIMQKFMILLYTWMFISIRSILSKSAATCYSPTRSIDQCGRRTDAYHCPAQLVLGPLHEAAHVTQNGVLRVGNVRQTVPGNGDELNEHQNNQPQTLQE
jgi:hypothetical protein